MIKRQLLSFLLIVVSLLVNGQGNRYGIKVVNYPPSLTQASEQNWAIVQDKRGVMYFGNDVDGIIEYDGYEWRKIHVPNNSIVRSLDCSDDGTVYVGAVSEFGYLAPNNTGDLEYVSLTSLVDSSESSFYNVWKTYCIDQKVYFHTHKYVFIYSPLDDSLITVRNAHNTLFGYFVNGKYYTGLYPEGLMVLKDTSQVLAKGGDYYKERDIFGLTGYDNEHLLVGVSETGLSLYNTTTGSVDLDFAPQATNDFLSNNFLYHLRKLNDNNFAASTIQGGLVILNRKGEIESVISKEQGLQDQTIYYSYQNSDPELYPLAHIWTAMSIGIGKISYDSYFKEYTESTDFHGLILTINSIDDVLFLGTMNGLFFADKSKKELSFTKVATIKQPVWDMKTFTLSNGEKVLVAIGLGGLFQVNKDGSVINLKDQIQGDFTESTKVFWGYDLFVDPENPHRLVLGRNSSIVSIIHKNGKWIQELSIDALAGEVRSTALTKDQKIWFSANLVGIGSLTEFTNTGEDIYYGTEHGLPAAENNRVYRVDDEILVGTINGLYRIYDSPDTVYFYRDSIYNPYLPKGKNLVMVVYRDPSGDIIISYQNEYSGWGLSILQKSSTGQIIALTRPFLSLDDFSSDAIYSQDGKTLWFSNSNRLYKLDKSKEFKEGSYQTIIRKVTLNEDSVIFAGAHPFIDQLGKNKIGTKQDVTSIPEIKYSYNNIEFRWSAPYFEQEDKIEFSYYLEGFSEGWSDWERVFYRDFTNLPNGNYTFRIKSRNVYGDEGKEDRFSFIILRPWYLSFVAFLVYIIVTVLLVYVIIILYTRRLKNENIHLEGIIQERTAEIRKQKEELTDSIEYASRIQRALLPPDQILSKFDFEHFILFRPRDIVSGDFYWIAHKNGKIYVVAADCTGHGVPGAFMSMLGISFLDEIVIKSGVSETNVILDSLRNHVITSLRQTGQSISESTKDGMDLAMVAIDEKTHSIQYSGAYNPLYAVRELTEDEKKTLDKKGKLDVERGSVYNETHLLYQVRADQMPIGISEKDFKFKAINIDASDVTLYLFSDGYVDQFGGPMGKKFMSKNFKKLLLDLQNHSMEEQHNMLEDTLLNWMGGISQIDDILVIGLRLSN